MTYAKCPVFDNDSGSWITEVIGRALPNIIITNSFTIMGLQSSDLILVERSNTIYKETYGNRANIDSSDLLASRAE